MARARDEKHRFDGQAEKVEVEPAPIELPDLDVRPLPNLPEQNSRRAALAARVRAARARGRP